MGAVNAADRAAAQWAGLREAWGIDFNSGFASVVRLRKSGKGEVVFEGDPATQASEWSRTLTDLAAVTGSGRGWVAAAQPATASVVRKLSVPLPSIGKARRVLPSILDVELPFPLENCTYHFPEVYRNAGDQRIESLAIAARNCDIEQQLEQLKQAKLDPEILDAQGLALWQAAEGKATGGHQVIAYFGTDQTVLAIGRDKLEAVHTIRHGLSPDRSDDLATRIKRIFRAQPLNEPIAWKSCGPSAVSTLRNISAPPFPRCGNTDQTPAAALETLLATLAIEGAPELLPDAASWLAFRLAQRVLNQENTACNLRGQETRHPRFAAALQKRSTSSALAYLLCGALLIGAAIGWDALLDDREASVQATISAKAEAITGFPVARGGERTIVKNHSKMLHEAGSPLTGAFRPSGLSDTASILQLVEEKGFVLTQLNWELNQVTLAGHAANSDDCKALKAWFTDRNFQVELEQGAGPDERISFTCSARRDA